MSNNHFEGNIAGERMSFLNWKSENDTAAPSPLLSRKGELQRRKAAAALELQRLDNQLSGANRGGQRPRSRPSSAAPLGLTGAHKFSAIREPAKFKIRPPPPSISPTRYSKRHGKVAWQQRRSGRANATVATTGKSMHDLDFCEHDSALGQTVHCPHYLQVQTGKVSADGFRPAKRIFEPNPNRIVSSAKGGTRKKFVAQGYTELVTDLLKSCSSKDSGLNLKFGSVPDLKKHQR